MSLQVSRMYLLMAAGLLAWVLAPPLCAGTPGPGHRDSLAAEVLHGTVQARINGHGDLVIALDQKRSSFEPGDGFADLVFLAAPLRDARLGVVAEALAQSVTDVTLEVPDGEMRLAVPSEAAFHLVTGPAGRVSGVQQDSTAPIPVVGIARYVIDHRRLTVHEALEAFEGFSVLGGRVGEATSRSR